MDRPWTRRDFARAAVGGALAALPVLGCASLPARKPAGIKISLQLPGEFTDDDLTFARQMGVDYVSVPTKAGTYELFAQIKARVEAAGSLGSPAGLAVQARAARRERAEGAV